MTTQQEIVHNYFSCPVCRHKEIQVSSAAWTCTQCRHTYPVEHGIPLLVRDWSQHEADIAQARAVRPDWYIGEQPPEAVSPWRHHLRKRRAYVEAAIQAYLREQGQHRATTLLDLGCGDGNHLAYLEKYTEALYGSDYNLVRLARAQARPVNATLFLADILDYPAQDDFFAVIFFNHVIEHIPDDMQALATVYRILQPGGLLILGTPNEGAWWWQLAYTLQPQARRTTDHVHFYTARTLGEKMRRAGFIIREIKHMGWGPPHWGLDGKIRRYRLVDGLFERFGRVLIPRQASSLYVLATKTP